MRRLRRRPGDDTGLAMVTVLAAMMVLTLLVTAAIAYTMGTFRRAHNDQDWNAALAAANAGVDEYISRLNDNRFYYLYGDTASPYTSASASVVRLPETDGETANAAFTGWQSIPDSDDRGAFHYEVDNSRYESDGLLRLRSTGKVGEQTRTVDVELRQIGFIDFLYFTDFETLDPARYSTASNRTWAQNNCVRYEYQGRSTSCTMIQFSSRDVIKGPLHTNDVLNICQSVFEGATTTSWANPPNSNRRYVNQCPSYPLPTFARAGDPGYSERLEMPPTNSRLKAETDPAQVPDPGCLYTGPTRITFHADATMTVRSPWTKSVNPGCGTPSTLRSSGGHRIPVPNNKVVYVQTVPTASSDPNSWGSRESGRPSCGSGNPLGYPVSNDVTSYGCQDGDIFVSGTLDGRVTLGSENNIVVVDNLQYERLNTSDADDILGLVANNYVSVYNPVRSNGNNLLSSRNLRIDAAILSVAHSFIVQNYDSGSRIGTLTVNGAIAQRFRGPVGTGTATSTSTGYDKNYVYDNRLQYAAPPKFLEPEETVFGIRQWTETSRAHEATAFGG